MSKSNMAALSGSFKSSQIKLKYILVNLLLLLHLTLAHVESQTEADVNLQERHRRAVVLAPVSASSVIPENVSSNVTLYNLTSLAPNRNYVVTNNSAGYPGLFQATNGILTIAQSITPEKRKLFDYERFKTFEVTINAINQTNSTDIQVITVRMKLSDVDDEPPAFTNKPTPFLATLPQDAESGTLVYTVTVEDIDLNPELIFTIDHVTLPDQSTALEKFKFNERAGGTKNKKIFDILTAGSGAFLQGATYTIKIVAQDTNTVAQSPQTSSTIVVQIGNLPPQFYEQSYKGRLYESTATISNWVLEANSNYKLGIQVKQFQTDNALTYRLLQQGNVLSQMFDIQAEGDFQRIVNRVPIDYEVTQSVSLTIQVTEAGTGLTSSVPILITFMDENDNMPIFFNRQYGKTVREDLPINSTVLVVEATDADSGLNGELVFSVENTIYFDVITTVVNKTYIGTVIVKRPLYYDLQTIEPFYVVASDKGTPPLRTKVQVTVTLLNINDNAPTISNITTIVNLIETTTVGSIVTVILASDIDGDAVRFYFEGKVDTFEIFKITDTNGQIVLNSAIPKEKNSYILKVIAVDDDSCCATKTGSRTSTATFTVSVIGLNLNKPVFVNCLLYDTAATVKENSPMGTPVIQVVATDDDRGENGVVNYRIEKPDPNTASGVFQIDNKTGIITVKANIIRDPIGFVQVTVVGSNPPSYQSSFPLLEGRCTFRVAIIDINNNPPTFSAPVFAIQVSISTNFPSNIYQMAATDDDFGPNANITYSFGRMDNTTLSTFSINSLTGIIRLEKSLNSVVSSYTLIVIANDNGIDPGPLTGTANLTVMVTFDNRKPPEWIGSPASIYEVSESAVRGSLITTLSCKSNTDARALEFRVYDTGSTITTDSRYFSVESFEQNGVSSMNLTVKSQLNYEVDRMHKLSIVCQSFGSVVLRAQLLTPVINILDANDETPEFIGIDENDGRYRGTVPEDAKAGTFILQLTAIDRDSTAGFNNVSFKLLGDNKDLFMITNSGNNRADLVTSPLLVLDRENISHYFVQVEAMDGAPASPPNWKNGILLPNSATRWIDIYVADVNDNPPRFDKPIYMFNVSENAPANSLVNVIQAQDPDESDQVGLEYRIIDGNVDNAFNIFSYTGEIKVAKKLDYESEPKVYNMTIMALDQNHLHSATTTIIIELIDENDNRPEFYQSVYDVWNAVTEEDKSITPQNPLFLVKVTATDADVNRPETSIRYYLYTNGQAGVDQLFTVVELSGEVYLKGPLDRDVPPFFTTITVEAKDEQVNPLSNYADVRIHCMDINDNAPEFNTHFLQGSVQEHSAYTYVMTVIATDKDQGNNGTVAYRAANVQPNPALSAMFIVGRSGDIYTTSDVSLLDRETVEQIFLVVQAFDDGPVPLSTDATVTITLIDINDHSPFFEQPFYSTSVSEKQASGRIMTLQAKDLDSDLKNKQMVFTLKGRPEDLKFFSVQSTGTEAVISLEESIDYETDPHVLNITLEVTDNVPGHVNTTTVQITVLDYNDNAPEFSVSKQSVVLTEEEPARATITTFYATDEDEGINAEIEYSIARASDPRYEFFIDPKSGVVETRKKLDREVQELITIIILATDKGEIPLTGSATLSVTLTDINDNPPRFRENYRPVMQENVDNTNTVVQVIEATDPDTRQYGPPFHFSLPIPCSEPACTFFTLSFDRNGDGGNGAATVRTSSRFDGEVIKYYYLPIVMSDMDNKPGSRTVTNTLTITIGDDNDNTMEPGNIA